METTTATPTGVSTWISLGQYRPGPDGGPLDGGRVRLRCPEGHVYVSGSGERQSGRIECPKCGEPYRYSGRDRLRAFLEEGGWIERFREVGRQAGPWAGVSADDFPVGFSLPGFHPEDVRERIFEAVVEEARAGGFVDWIPPNYPDVKDLEPWPLDDDVADVLVPFRTHGPMLVPSRPLRQAQFAAAQVAMAETQKGYRRSVTEEADHWAAKVRDALLDEREHEVEGDDGEATSIGSFHIIGEILRARHRYTAAQGCEDSGERRQDAKERMERLWRKVGIEAGLLPDVYGPGRDPHFLLPDDVLRDVHEAGMALARDVRDYDPTDDARALAALEPLPQDDLETWARVLWVGGLFTPEEVETLTRPLPGPEDARNDSTRVSASPGLPVVRVAAARLGLHPASVADRLDLPESVKGYIDRHR